MHTSTRLKLQKLLILLKTKKTYEVWTTTNSAQYSVYNISVVDSHNSFSVQNQWIDFTNDNQCVMCFTFQNFFQVCFLSIKKYLWCKKQAQISVLFHG